jgi:hypothetical protein
VICDTGVDRVAWRVHEEANRTYTCDLKQCVFCKAHELIEYMKLYNQDYYLKTVKRSAATPQIPKRKFELVREQVLAAALAWLPRRTVKKWTANK